MIASNVLPAGWKDVFSRDHRRIAIGVDPATTTKAKSNPTGLAVVQQVGLSYFVRVLLRFKTDDPRVTDAIIEELLELPHGLKSRRVAILATNERFYASALKRKLSGRCPVELVIESEACEYLGQKMSYKSYLGNQLVNTIEDGYLAVPNERWVAADLRQTNRDKGTFAAEVDEHGNHADCFCAIAAALHGLRTRGDRAEASGAAVGALSGMGSAASWLKNPYAAARTKKSNIHV